MAQPQSSRARRQKKFFQDLAACALAFGFILQFTDMLNKAAPDAPRPTLDVRRGHSAADVAPTLDAYGPYGRKLYAVIEVADLVLMYGYGSVLSTLLSTGMHMVVPQLKPLSWLPIAAALVDLVENSAMLLMLATYPAAVPTLSHVTAGAGKLKWVLVYATASVLLGTGFFCIFKAATSGGKQPGRAAGSNSSSSAGAASSSAKSQSQSMRKRRA